MTTHQAGDVDVLVIGCGPRRDARARVVRPDGTAVPGLYAAGGAGTVWGPFTHSGGGLTDALGFGRLAGQESARS